MNTLASPATETRNCLRCGRKLRSAEAVARGYGAGCWARVRSAERTADLSAWTESQIEDARQAIEDGAVVPSTRPGVFHVVSVDGTEVHRTHRNGCNCTNGLKTQQPRPCFHRCAVVIVLASQAPAVPVRAPLALLSVPVPAPAPAGDVWAALAAVGALDLVPAF
jgi:hypothetical protein